MEITKERERLLPELRRAHQEACNAMLRARLEGRPEAVVAEAAQRVQRAANALFAARLDQEPGVRPGSMAPARA